MGSSSLRAAGSNSMPVARVIVTVVEDHQPFGGATVTLVGPQGQTQTGAAHG